MLFPSHMCFTTEVSTQFNGLPNFGLVSQDWGQLKAEMKRLVAQAYVQRDSVQAHTQSLYSQPNEQYKLVRISRSCVIATKLSPCGRSLQTGMLEWKQSSHAEYVLKDTGKAITTSQKMSMALQLGTAIGA